MNNIEKKNCTEITRVAFTLDLDMNFPWVTRDQIWCFQKNLFFIGWTNCFRIQLKRKSKIQIK